MWVRDQEQPGAKRRRIVAAPPPPPPPQRPLSVATLPQELQYLILVQAGQWEVLLQSVPPAHICAAIHTAAGLACGDAAVASATHRERTVCMWLGGLATLVSRHPTATWWHAAWKDLWQQPDVGVHRFLQQAVNTQLLAAPVSAVETPQASNVTPTSASSIQSPTPGPALQLLYGNILEPLWQQHGMSSDSLVLWRYLLQDLDIDIRGLLFLGPAWHPTRGVDEEQDNETPDIMASLKSFSHFPVTAHAVHALLREFRALFWDHCERRMGADALLKALQTHRYCMQHWATWVMGMASRLLREPPRQHDGGGVDIRLSGMLGIWYDTTHNIQHDDGDDHVVGHDVNGEADHVLVVDDDDEDEADEADDDEYDEDEYDEEEVSDDDGL